MILTEGLSIFLQVNITVDFYQKVFATTMMVSMKIDISEKWLPVYEALASDVRLRIIQLISQKPMNIKELAKELGLSSAIVSMHVRKLESAKLIQCDRTHVGGAIQKQCRLIADFIEIGFPKTPVVERKKYEFSIPVGHYTDFEVTPTCGLATTEKLIGYFDDPRFFLDMERVNAKILWFSQGFIEYTIPNFLLSNEKPLELEISMELGSEAPGVNNNWPSDISFFFNNVRVGQWTSPGDFGGERGRFTPVWWSLNHGQFGLLKILKVNSQGTFIDGMKVSDIKIQDIDLNKKYWRLRIESEKDTRNSGGVTLFGLGFGNYNQDILMSLYYE